MPVSYLEEAFSETWIYTKDDRSLRDVFLSPRHKSYGEKLCVHEIKVMYRSGRFETNVNQEQALELSYIGSSCIACEGNVISRSRVECIYA